MQDYLNEFLLFAKNRRDGTYTRALRLKRRGDAEIFNTLALEWISRFKWKTKEKDDAIASELIERTLLFDGMAAFRKISMQELVDKSFETRFVGDNSFPDEKPWRLFRVSGTDNLSFYGYSNRATLTDFAGRVYGTCLVVQDGDILHDDSMCILARDSQLWNYPIMKVFYYAEKLSIIEASINACIQNITGTTIITCSREQEKQLLKERKAASVGVPWIVRYDEIYKSGEETKLLTSPGASEELKTLYSAQNKTHADFLQSIGIRANNEVDRRTGVNPLEIVQSRQNVDIVLNNALEMRKKAVEQLHAAGLKGINVDLQNFESLVTDYDANGQQLEKAGKDSEVKEE